MQPETVQQVLARLLELVWLLLPAYCANMAPPFVKFWHGWNRPLHRRLLGDHKTVVGFGLGVAVAGGAAFLQSRLSPAVSLLWGPDAWVAVGLASGVGALGGDAIKSFFKRRLGLAPGASWIPADQLDFAVGALIGLALFVPLSASDVVLVLAFTFVADIAVNQIAFRVGIRDTPW